MRIVLLLTFVCALSACSSPIETLKSPCVGAEKSPCDFHVPSHQWQS